MLRNRTARLLPYLSTFKRLYSTTTTNQAVPLAFQISHPTLDKEGNPTYSDLAPTLVFHGLFGYGANWRSISNRLATIIGSDIYQIDLRNHGSSPHHPVMDYPSMVDDILDFMKRQKIEKTNIMAHSMGAKVGMLFALNHPSLIEKLIVVDAPPSSTRSHTTPFKKYTTLMKNMPLKNIISRREADKWLKEEVPDESVRAFLLSNLAVDNDAPEGEIGWRWRPNLDVLEKNLEIISDFPVPEGKTFEGDTLFVGGSKSPYINQENIPLIKKLFPKASITYIEGAGHWVHSEKPNEFIDVVSKFLKNENPK
eukprot:TRINITY_DN394_c0_g2_i1.p1 TRINITY_DN394_c0_g2~~TRINITY_DN394_c0_g2_i1.p1  ORF type:complete len:310 (+),score=58.49 TRINITY_DN394_c0_g2_i1:186-1115(+)